MLFRFAAAALALLATPSQGAVNVELLGSYRSGIFDESAAEIVAYDPCSFQAFVTNSNDSTVDVIDISDPTMPLLAMQINLPTGFAPNSVAVLPEEGLVAVACKDDEDDAGIGIVALYTTMGGFLGSVDVGVGPDMLAFSPDGEYLMVCNEGEPTDDVDPVGSVSIIEVEDEISDFEAVTVGFEGFDGMEDALRMMGVRIFPGKMASEDFEPEYLAFSLDSKKAYVTLQENNAVAIIDIDEEKVEKILPLGLKDHGIFPLDPSDRDDSISIETYPGVVGMYMPDSITAFEIDGKTYFATANEGDARDEDDRVKDLVLDPTAFPDAAALQQDEVLGRLEVSTIDGDIDGDGDFDVLYAYGSRSFTIWDEDGLVFDSGSEIEELLAVEYTANFNSNNDENDSFDSRSDAKGGEPEAITSAVIGGKTIVFVGLERMSAIVMYDVSDPYNPVLGGIFDNRDFSGDAKEGTAGDLGPEDIKVIPAADSPIDSDLLIVANEVSGSTTVYSLTPEEKGKKSAKSKGSKCPKDGKKAKKDGKKGGKKDGKKGGKKDEKAGGKTRL